MCDITLVADNKPVAMQSNPAYGATVRKDTITTTNAESVAMQSNPAYGATVRKDTITTTNAESVDMQSNPAYGEMIEDNQNQKLYFN